MSDPTHDGRRPSRLLTGGRGLIILRLVAIGAVLLLSYASLRRSIAWSLRENHIDLAYRIAPDDARVAAAWSSADFGFGERRSARGPALLAAKVALTRDPTSVQAVSTLALDAEARGNRAKALALARFGQMLSRRDLRTQLFLLQAAVEANDIKAALTHYDYVLRTSDQGPSLLFPVLRKAVTFPEVRANLVETFARHPPWGRLYLYDLATKGPDYSAAGTFVSELHRARLEVPADAEDRLITRLVEQGGIDQAWMIYHARFPQALSDGVRNGSFSSQRSSTPFDWIFAAGAGAVAELGREGGHGGLLYDAPADVGGVVARQLLLLSERRYRFTGSATLFAAEAASAPAWRLRCADGRLISSIALSKGAVGSSIFAADVLVPSACAAQWLELIVPPSDAIDGNHGIIEHVTIAPIRQ